MEARRVKGSIAIIVVIGVLCFALGIAIGLRPNYKESRLVFVDKAVSGDKTTYNDLKIIEDYKKELKEEFKEETDTMNAKFDTIIAILGLAVTVWIGLNIYNVVERGEIEKLESEVQKIKTELNDMSIAYNDNVNTMQEWADLLGRLVRDIVNEEE